MTATLFDSPEMTISLRPPPPAEPTPMLETPWDEQVYPDTIDLECDLEEQYLIQSALADQLSKTEAKIGQLETELYVRRRS